MSDEPIRRAIEASDTDELIRIVDGQVGARSWDDLVELRGRCDEAATRGKQLWGVSEYIRYRLALDAPGRWAGPAVSEGPTRFTLGPLPEVAASTKGWEELDPHLGPGPERTTTALERVIRGEVLETAGIDPMTLELPLRLQDWEPVYSLATYHSDRVECPNPAPAPVSLAQIGPPGDPVEDADGSRALLALVEHWVESSNGRAQVACIAGSADSAVAALGVSRAGIARVAPGSALAWMAWAAASGGAHGRRRGAAAGRFHAWWAAHELAGLDWPVDPDHLGSEIARLRWHLWTDGSPATGWALRLAVEDPGEGIAWALAAVDAD